MWISLIASGRVQNPQNVFANSDGWVQAKRASPTKSDTRLGPIMAVGVGIVSRVVTWARHWRPRRHSQNRRPIGDSKPLLLLLEWGERESKSSTAECAPVPLTPSRSLSPDGCLHSALVALHPCVYRMVGMSGKFETRSLRLLHSIRCCARHQSEKENQQYHQNQGNRDS